MEVGPGPDNIDHTREFEIYPVGNGEPLKLFEQESNMVQDQFRKITLVAASGVDFKGEPGDRGTRKRSFNPEEQDEGLNGGSDSGKEEEETNLKAIIT